MGKESRWPGSAVGERKGGCSGFAGERNPFPVGHFSLIHCLLWKSESKGQRQVNME